ncbi:MAG: restriction endonuclease subunit S [Arenicella sp.]
MVPEGWVSGRVGDMLDGLESGVSVNGENRPLKEKEKGVLKVSAVSYGRFNSSAAKAIDSKDLVRAKTNPKQGQIIISRSNTEKFVGASAYIDRDYPNLFLPDKLWQTISDEKSDMKWLSYVLASKPARYILSRLATGTSGSMKNITKGELLSLKILIPSSPEQQKIAETLSTWDKAITATEKLIANSQQQKKALMQQLLTGRRRLPGFNKKWLQFKLSELGQVSSAGVDKKNVDEERRVRLLNFLDVFNRSYICSDDLNHWVTAPNYKIAKCNVLKGDVFFTPSSETRKDIGMSVVSTEDINDCCYSYHIVRFRLKDKWNIDYLGFAFSTDKFKKQTYRLADGSGQRYVLSLPSFKSIEVYYPAIEEQMEIGRRLVASYKIIELLKLKRETLKQEKKALMQQLLTGKRRVSVA